MRNCSYDIDDRKSRMEIAFVCNDAYACHLSVTIASILRNADPNDNFSFHVLTDDLTIEKQEKICSLSYIRDFAIDFKYVDASLFDKYPLMLHFSRQTYYRFLIPFFYTEHEKILYLDSDLIVRGSLRRLYNTNFCGRYAVVVRGAGHAAEGARRLGLKNYFNAGVMLINLRKWIADDIGNKLFANTEILAQREMIKAADQCVLNFSLNDEVVFVENKFNFTLGHYQQWVQCRGEKKLGMKDIPDVLVAHFTSGEKPWTPRCSHPFKDEYFYYLRLTPFSD